MRSGAYLAKWFKFPLRDTEAQLFLVCRVVSAQEGRSLQVHAVLLYGFHGRSAEDCLLILFAQFTGLPPRTRVLGLAEPLCSAAQSRRCLSMTSRSLNGNSPIMKNECQVLQDARLLRGSPIRTSVTREVSLPQGQRHHVTAVSKRSLRVRRILGACGTSDATMGQDL